jgi:hypothetical protein
LQQETKHKTSEGWPKYPKTIPFYRDNWGPSQLYDRPMDWVQQSNEYDEKLKAYEKEKMDYDAFCKKKLGEIQEIQEPTSKEKEEQEELQKRKASEEKFLAFSSEKYPNHPAYTEYIEEQKRKKQKHKHTFNSPKPKKRNNKENIEI